MVYHPKQKTEAKKEKVKSFMSPENSKKHSWLQSRTCDLVREKYPDGNGFTDNFWSECYRQAVKEWNEQQHTVAPPPKDS